MKEIEVKLTYKDRNIVINKLKEIKAVFREKYVLEDHYYSMNGKDMSNSNELIRVRKKGDKSELTFKGKCENQSNIWERVELTTSLGNPESMLKILESLKFNKLSVTKSNREIWNLDDVEIAIIEIFYPANIDFIEIEGPTKEKVEKTLNLMGKTVKEATEEIFKHLDEARNKQLNTTD